MCVGTHSWSSNAMWKRRIWSSESPPAVGSRQIFGSRAGARLRT